jgi:hypothetical protein
VVQFLIWLVEHEGTAMPLRAAAVKVLAFLNATEVVPAVKRELDEVLEELPHQYVGYGIRREVAAGVVSMIDLIARSSPAEVDGQIKRALSIFDIGDFFDSTARDIPVLSKASLMHGEVGDIASLLFPHIFLEHSDSDDALRACGYEILKVAPFAEFSSRRFLRLLDSAELARPRGAGLVREPRQHRGVLQSDFSNVKLFHFSSPYTHLCEDQVDSRSFKFTSVLREGAGERRRP